MSEQTEDVRKFLDEYANDVQLQHAFALDSGSFLRSASVPREFGDAVIAITSELNKKKITLLDEAVADEAVVERTMSARPLKGPSKGKPHIGFKPTRKLGVFVGYDMILDNQASDDVSDGLLVAAGIAALIVAADPEGISKVAAAVIGAALVIESRVIKLINRGNGVYYFLNALLIPTIPVLGPAALAGSIVGPLPN